MEPNPLLEIRQAKGFSRRPDIEKDLLQEKQARLRFTTPEQIGALATYLCSDAAQTITGASPSIGGGWTTH
ncbi:MULTISPECIES: SDR family oxidoreductase [Acidiphilium]|uniref:SDR family oxidoreductase n=1 Tax=Acidiphilium TaxID=522 RepID=UPI0021CB9773|nr:MULTISPECIES: SDR family oxidoreductase [Acidiphilium]